MQYSVEGMKGSSEAVQELANESCFNTLLRTPSPDTDPNNVTIADLAIPDTMCSLKGGGGYECPGEMVSSATSYDE